MGTIIMVWASILVVGFVGFWLCVYYVHGLWEEVSRETFPLDKYGHTCKITYQHRYTKETRILYK